jgi:hypothetical protein
MPLVFIRSLGLYLFTYWTKYLLLLFVIASVLVFALSRRKRLSGVRAYLIRFVAALLIAITMGLYVESPWLATTMVSVATGLLFRNLVIRNRNGLDYLYERITDLS